MESYVDISSLQISGYYIITDSRSFSTADNTLYRPQFFYLRDFKYKW